MKRSEMIDCLCTDLLTMDGFLNYSYGGHELPSSYEEIAGTVIDFLISKGMKPPMLEEESFKILPNGEMTYGVHEWEPE